ncbi:hypothetical protein CHS0354_018642 [Potamilus streckersoni]|uniref:Carboxylic ester hydrolase n=1 Tax=Potamilus streckersoni TaxID=2493646 RepID=A0AAE0SK98_9BIVA|nr:hypothetical protein CHS0354_018642 [Potamilus streckersoni]
MASLLVNLLCPMVICCVFIMGDGAVVETLNGPVQGFTESVINTKIDIYLSIPYAKPPLGSLRFRKPEPVENWNSVLSVTKLPNSCFQTIDNSWDRFQGVEMWNANTLLSEDCLYLSLWVPQNTGGKLATLIWIYGGFFVLGTSTLDIYDGKLLAAKNNVIVASIQYRLGPLGFLYLGSDDVPGNMGLWDQQMAIKWIYDNIELFGGDRKQITLFGESAGAASVNYHLISKHSQEYFTNAILESGSALSNWAFMPPDVAIRYSKELGRKMECETSNHDSFVQCLKSADAHNLTEKVWNFMGNFITYMFAPTLDGEFLENFPLDLLNSGRMKNCSMLAGMTKDEGTYFLAYFVQDYFPNNKLWSPDVMSRDTFLSALDQVVPMQGSLMKEAVVYEYELSRLANERGSYIDILDEAGGDKSFKCPTIDLARYYKNAFGKSQSVFMYSFEHRTSVVTWPEWMGVIHGYELDLVFGQPFRDNATYTSDEKILSDTIMKYWTNFAKYGDPSGPNLTTWPGYDLDVQSYIILDVGDNLQVRQGLRHRECTFWREFIPKVLQAGTDFWRKPQRHDLKCTVITFTLAHRMVSLYRMLNIALKYFKERSSFCDAF